MALRIYEVRESWTVLVSYEIESDTQEEGISDIKESNPARKEFEVVSRQVEKIINVDEKSM